MSGHSRSFVAKSTGPPIRDTHVYQPRPDWPSSDPPCSVCEHTRAHRVHDVGEVPEEARRIDARVLGEGGEDN